MELYVNVYCNVVDRAVYLDDKLLFKGDSDIALNVFLTDVYKKESFEYPKFFKMDNLSKAGFIATELIMKKASNIEENKRKEMAVLMSNSVSSLDTDINYNNTVSDDDNYFPSPSLFVYTLPNIVTGEIAIRHKIMGETTFTVCDRFESSFFDRHIRHCFNTCEISAMICGWIDVLGNDCRVFTFIVERLGSEDTRLTPELLDRLYNV